MDGEPPGRALNHSHSEAEGLPQQALDVGTDRGQEWHSAGKSIEQWCPTFVMTRASRLTWLTPCIVGMPDEAPMIGSDLPTYHEVKMYMAFS